MLKKKLARTKYKKKHKINCNLLFYRNRGECNRSTCFIVPYQNLGPPIGKDANSTHFKNSKWPYLEINNHFWGQFPLIIINSINNREQNWANHPDPWFIVADRRMEIASGLREQFHIHTVRFTVICTMRQFAFHMVKVKHSHTVRQIFAFHTVKVKHSQFFGADFLLLQISQPHSETLFCIWHGDFL